MKTETQNDVEGDGRGNDGEATRSYAPYADPERVGVVRLPIRTNKHVGMEAMIDAADRHLVEGRRWNWSPGKPNPKTGRVTLCGAGIALARIIMGVSDPEMLVAHVNGDALDLRRENLVIRTRSESALLRKPSMETVERLKPYPDPERAGVWRVPLKSNVANREALVDEADLPIIEGKNWNWSSRRDGRMDGRVVLATMGKQIPLARMILGVDGTDAKVRFLNADPLDCRRENLLIIDKYERARSARKMGIVSGRKYTSTYKGVSRDEERGKWKAQLHCGTAYAMLGRFDTEIDAAMAYDAAVRVKFGPIGLLNFPGEDSTQAMLDLMKEALARAERLKKAARLKQRKLELALRRAASEPVSMDDEQTATIPLKTAREMFDVVPTVWKRWEKLGWLPQAKIVGKNQPVYRLCEIERLLSRCGLTALPYPDPELPNVYRVPLSGETSKGMHALIDADVVQYVQFRRWRLSSENMSGRRDVQTMIPTENIHLHQVVMGVTGRDLFISFINGDPLDCRKSNLLMRDGSHMNAGMRKWALRNGEPCTSRFKGVCMPKKSSKWLAYIKKDRVKRNLGSFEDEIAAAQAYDEAARELFGEYARLNFPNGVDRWLEEDAKRMEESEREAA